MLMVTLLLCWLGFSLVCTLGLLAAAARPLRESHEQLLSNGDSPACPLKAVHAKTLPAASAPKPVVKPMGQPVAAELVATV